MFFKRKKREPRDPRLRAMNSEFPQQFNIRINEKQRNIIRDFQNLKRQGKVEFTVAQMFRGVIDEVLQPQLEALIEKENLLNSNHDFTNHPKRNQ